MTAPQILGGATLIGTPELGTARVNMLSDDTMPQHYFVDVAGNNAAMTITGTIGGQAIQATGWWCSILTWTTTQNANIGWDMTVPGGTYTVEWFISQRNDHPQIRAQIDGSNIGSLTDLYIASGTASPYCHRVTGVAVTRGTHHFRITCPSKNASSSGYVMPVCALGLVRTGP